MIVDALQSRHTSVTLPGWLVLSKGLEVRGPRGLRSSTSRGVVLRVSVFLLVVPSIGTWRIPDLHLYR